MSIFRIEKTKNYTVMSNHHLRDKTLSLKAKGLLSYMLSQPDDWDFSLRGLCLHCKEDPETLGKIVHELINNGYVEREQKRNNGRFGSSDYIVREQPVEKKADGVFQPGVKIKGILKEKGITQKQFSIQVGIPESALSRYLKGERIPNPSDALKICQSTGIYPEEWFKNCQLSDAKVCQNTETSASSPCLAIPYTEMPCTGMPCTEMTAQQSIIIPSTSKPSNIKPSTSVLLTDLLRARDNAEKVENFVSFVEEKLQKTLDLQDRQECKTIIDDQYDPALIEVSIEDNLFRGSRFKMFPVRKQLMRWRNEGVTSPTDAWNDILEARLDNLLSLAQQKAEEKNPYMTEAERSKFVDAIIENSDAYEIRKRRDQAIAAFEDRKYGKAVEIAENAETNGTSIFNYLPTELQQICREDSVLFGAESV